MTLRVGDKVKLREADRGAHPSLRTDKEYRVAKVYDASCVALEGYGPRAVAKGRLEKVEDQPTPLGLQPGDKVVNLKTGREGLVLKGPISGELKVYDQKPPIRDAVPAAALEEYEFHHPGTYDVWRLSEKLKAAPW